MKPAPKLAGGSGDPPLRCFGRITAESDNGRGKPLPPFFGIFSVNAGVSPFEAARRVVAPYGCHCPWKTGGHRGPPLRRFRHMTDKQDGGQPGKGRPPSILSILPPSRRPAAVAGRRSGPPPTRMWGSPPPYGSASKPSPPPGTGGPDSSKAPSCEIPCCADWRRSPDRCGRAHRERPAGSPVRLRGRPWPFGPERDPPKALDRSSPGLPGKNGSQAGRSPPEKHSGPG